MAKHDNERALLGLGLSSSLATLGLALGLSALSGCVLWMRDPEFYAEELTELVEGQEDAIAACYDRVLSEHDPEASGDLRVEFDVEKRTGALTNIAIDASQTTVPEPLSTCVTAELARLRLEPPDTKTGRASLTWTFAPGPPKPPPADPFASSQAAVLACYATHLSEVDREAQGELVIDYAFNRETGALARVDVVPDATTAPAPVVECARSALGAARLEPDELDERNATGRRSFALRYAPHQ